MFKKAEGGGAGQGSGTARVCSLKVRVMEVKEEMQGAGRAAERESARIVAVMSSEKVGWS